MPTFHYSPILKAKTGEIRALQWLRGRVRPNLMPIWELLPKLHNESFRDALQLAECWGTEHRILVDHGHIAARDGELEAAHHVRSFFEFCSGRARAIPVLRPSNGIELNVALLSQVQGNEGCAFRIPANEILRSYSAVLSLIALAFQRVRVCPSSIDLIVDFGALPENVSELQIAETARGLANIPALREWRTFVVAAGAFPVDLKNFVPGTVQRTPRADWDLWRQLVRSGLLPRTPEFGDYAVQHPNLPPTIDGPVRASPSLRYTADDYWLVVRGKRDKGQPARPSQFRDRCIQLVERAEFAGQFLCDGDEAIARCAAGSVSNGDQSFWRAVATDHHITLVWDRLMDIAASQAA